MVQLFKSKDGKIYDTEKECLAADKAYDDKHNKDAEYKKDLADFQKLVADYNAHYEEREKANEAELNNVNKVRHELIKKYGKVTPFYSEILDLDDIFAEIFHF